MELKDLYQIEGRRIYLKLLAESLENNIDLDITFSIVVTQSFKDLELLLYYKEKFGQISIADFAKWHKEKFKEEYESSSKEE